MSWLERFEERFLPEPMSGCWLWTASVNRAGYGIFCAANKDRNKRRIGAHRAAYEFYVGLIPKGRWVLHRCDVPCCVNPQHLFLGDHAANTKDKMLKGRARKNIGPEKALAIRAEQGTYEEIARKHGVHFCSVRDIKKTWAWLQ